MRLKKGITIAVVAGAVLILADLISTMLLKDLLPYLEANPFFSKIGLVGIVILNVVMVGGMYHLYNKTNSTTYRYIWINLLVTIILMKLLAVINNVQVYLNPPTIEIAQQITTEMKVQVVTSFGWMAVVPYAISIITFYLFKFDHKIEVKEK